MRCVTKGKQLRAYFKSKNIVSIDWPLQLLNMDIFGQSKTIILGGNVYIIVIVDEKFHYIWTLF